MTVNHYFITPLYRDLVPLPEPGGLVPLPRSNYNRYNLYVLRTRLQVLTRRQWQRSDLNFVFESVEYSFEDEPARLYIQARPTVGDKTLRLNLAQLKQYQTIIKLATSTPLDYAVLFSDKDFIYKELVIPGFWILMVLPYIPFSSQQVQHRFSEYGLEVKTYPHQNTGYPSYPADEDLINFDIYIEKLADIRVPIEDTLVRWFQRGVWIDPPAEIINKWNMKSIKPKVYQLNWIDRRITDPFKGRWFFLNSRIMGHKKVFLPVGDNKITVHRVAKLFYDEKIRYIPVFYGRNVCIEVGDYPEVNTILRNLEQISHSDGKVIVFRVTESKFIPAYTKIGHDLGLKDIVFYYNDGFYGKELHFSCEVEDHDLDIQVLIHKIQRQTLKYIS